MSLVPVGVPVGSDFPFHVRLFGDVAVGSVRLFLFDFVTLFSLLHQMRDAGGGLGRVWK